MILIHCLDPERRAAVLREMRRVVKGEPYRWPQVKEHPAKHVRSPIRRANREQ